MIGCPFGGIHFALGVQCNTAEFQSPSGTFNWEGERIDLTALRTSPNSRWRPYSAPIYSSHKFQLPTCSFTTSSVACECLVTGSASLCRVIPKEEILPPGR